MLTLHKESVKIHIQDHNHKNITYIFILIMYIQTFALIELLAFAKVGLVCKSRISIPYHQSVAELLILENQIFLKVR